MGVPNKYRFVRHSRSVKEMNKVTISGYNKIDVMNKLFERIKFHDVEKANHWAAELVASGQTWNIMQKLISFASHEININNPNLPEKLLARVNLCKEYLSKDPLQDRNVQEIRNLISEVTTILCLSSKKPSKMPKIGEVDFEIEYLTARVISKSTSLADQILTPEDPKDLVVPVNELATHVVLLRRQTANKMSLLTKDVGALDPYYWLSWLLEWDKHMTSRRLKDIDYRCASRRNPSYDSKLSMDVVWVIWDTILRLNETFDDPQACKQVTALYSLFTMDYARGKRVERKFLMNHAIQLLTNPVDYNLLVFIDHKRVVKTQALINWTYAIVLKEAHEWDEQHRNDKVSQYIIAEVDNNKDDCLLTVEDKTDDNCSASPALLTPEEFGNISEEIESGGLLPAIETKPKRSDTLSVFQERKKDYEPVIYDRSHEAPPPKTGSTMIFTNSSRSTDSCSSHSKPHEQARPQPKPSNTSSIRTRKIKETSSSQNQKCLDKTSFLVSKCPDGSISLPLNCTKGVGCLYLSHSDVAKHNTSPSPREEVIGFEPEYVEILIAPNNKEKQDRMQQPDMSADLQITE